MRVLSEQAKIYFMHKELTPDNVRFTDMTTLLPEVGDELTGNFGDMGDAIRSRVVSVHHTGIAFGMCESYDVILAGQDMQ